MKLVRWSPVATSVPLSDEADDSVTIQGEDGSMAGVVVADISVEILDVTELLRAIPTWSCQTSRMVILLPPRASSRMMSL